jgi:FtsP/CotA-like multicopper oxidase with cupredoxin domain
VDEFMVQQINRREFLAVGSAAVIAASEHLHQLTAPTDFNTELPIPPVLSPVKSDSTTDYYEMTQRQTWAEIIPRMRTQIRCYNGTFPGPTIKARRDRRTVVTHTNQLSIPTVAHLHGGVTKPDSDGFPTDTIAPGGSRTYEYGNSGPAATLWYHDHSWHNSGRNLYMGLAGFYLLEDPNDNAPLPREQYDIPLMLQDRSFTSDGEMDYDHQSHHGASGNIMLVNGAPWPVLRVAARKYRFRILNASNATHMALSLNTKQSFVEIGTDQGLLSAPVSLPIIRLAMAERVEVVIDFSVYSIGTRIVLENRAGHGRLGRVMCFDVVRKERDDSFVPTSLAELETLRPSTAVRTRTFVFGGRPTLGLPPGVRWVINGEAFDPERVDAEPRLGDVEIWRFVSRSFLSRGMLHPVHTHLVPFQILTRNGQSPRAEERGWKDTVAVDRDEVVEVIVRWSGYRGRYLLHCHNLEHEDHSMMARVDVI